MSEEGSGARSSRAREVVVLVAVVVVVAIVVALKLLGGQGGGGGSSGQGSDPSATASEGSVPDEPDSAPGQGTYVESTVAADGTVSVRQWIRSSAQIRALQVAAVLPQSSQTESAQAVDVMVRSLDGKVLAKRGSVGGDPVRLQLNAAVPNLYLSYRITGGIDDASQTVQGRLLADVLAMDVNYSGSSGSVQHKVVGPGMVINVACVRVNANADAPPKPCGAPTEDGGWLVNLRGIDRTDRLLAQIDTSPASPSS